MSSSSRNHLLILNDTETETFAALVAALLKQGFNVDNFHFVDHEWLSVAELQDRFGKDSDVMDLSFCMNSSKPEFGLPSIHTVDVIYDGDGFFKSVMWGNDNIAKTDPRIYYYLVAEAKVARWPGGCKLPEPVRRTDRER